MDNEKKSIIKQLQEIAEDICSDYCKYPGTWDEEAEGVELCESAICKECPLNRMV